MDKLKRLAILGVLLLAGWRLLSLQAEVATLERDLGVARAELVVTRVAHGQAVIEALEAGREMERDRQRDLMGVINDLDEQNRAARRSLDDARRRLRQHLDGGASAGAGGADVPDGAGAPCEPVQAYRARVLEAARSLADGVLAVGADADEAARERNALIRLDGQP